MPSEKDIPEEVAERLQHNSWIEDYKRWRKEHREALQKLAKIQISMLSREELLDREFQHIKDHEAELLQYELLGIEQFRPDPDELIMKHEQLAQRHASVRAAHKNSQRVHEKMLRQIDILLDLFRQPDKAAGTE